MVRHSAPACVDKNITSLFPTLLEILKDIPRIDFDPSLSWRGNSFNLESPASRLTLYLDWAPPDQLVYSTISALLQVCNEQPQYREKAMDAICCYLSKTVEEVTSRSCA